MQGEDIATDKEFSVGQLIRAVQYGDFPVVETAIGMLVDKLARSFKQNYAIYLSLNAI